MRILRQAAPFGQLAAEILELSLEQPAFEEGPSVDAG